MKARLSMSGGDRLRAFVAEANRVQAANRKVAIDVGWIETPEALTAFRNEFGLGKRGGPQARERPSLRNTQDAMPEIAGSIIQATLPAEGGTMRVRKQTAELIGVAGKRELRDQVQRLGVVDTGKMKRAISARVTVRGRDGPPD